jgi:hypothetical protein
MTPTAPERASIRTISSALLFARVRDEQPPRLAERPMAFAC